VVKFIKSFSILSSKAKWRMVLLLPIMITGMMLETLSVAMVVPALGIMMNQEFLDSIPLLLTILQYFNYPSHQQLVILGLSGLAGSFLVKNIFLFYQIKLQGTFVYGAQREVSRNLFQIYLNKDYLFHLQVNSSALIRNLTTEILTYCNFFLMPFLNLLSEALVIFSIMCLILWIEPKGTLVFFLATGMLIYCFIKGSNKVVGGWGRKRLQAEEDKIKHLQQGFGGIKEILLSGKVEFFLKRYHKPNQTSGLMNKREYIFSYVPKLGVEVISVLGLVAMCIYLVLEGKSHLEVTQMLGLLATAGFRLIPSFSRVLNNLQSIRFGWASVATLVQEFKNNGNEENVRSVNPTIVSEQKAVTFDRQMELKDVTFFYNDAVPLILDNLNLTIKKGETIGIVGPSGSGKSTLVNLLLGLLSPRRGEILLDGEKLEKHNLSSWQSMIGYVPQDIYVLDDTIRRNIAFGVDDDLIDDDRVHEVLRASQLDDLCQNSGEGLCFILGERGTKLSGGQKQRLGIARALYHNPSVIIFDEATSGLDKVTRSEILKTILDVGAGKTIIIVSHDEQVLGICDSLFNLKD